MALPLLNHFWSFIFSNVLCLKNRIFGLAKPRRECEWHLPEKPSVGFTYFLFFYHTVSNLRSVHFREAWKIGKVQDVSEWNGSSEWCLVKPLSSERSFSWFLAYNAASTSCIFIMYILITTKSSPTWYYLLLIVPFLVAMNHLSFVERSTIASTKVALKLFNTLCCSSRWLEPSTTFYRPRSVYFIVIWWYFEVTSTATSSVYHSFRSFYRRNLSVWDVIFEYSWRVCPKTEGTEIF